MAFAFCCADALVETAADGKVVFVAGATRRLFGSKQANLCGMYLRDLVAEADRPLFEALLERAACGGRFIDSLVAFGNGAKSRKLVLSGYGVPDLGDHCFLAVRNPGIDELAVARVSRDPAGMLRAEAFAESLERRMGAGAEADVSMTVFGLTGLPELKRRLADGEWRALEARIVAFLGALSVDGDTTTRFGEDRFGFLHLDGLDLDGVQGQIRRLSEVADPSGIGCGVSTETTAFSAIDLSGHDAARAVLYTLRELSGGAAARLDERAGADLSVAGRLHRTAANLQFVRETIRQERFEIAFQPIVSLHGSQQHHFEALVRLPNSRSGGNPGLDPYRFVCFAEDINLIGEFDFAMCRKLCRCISELSAKGPILPVAVNVSGRTIVSEGFHGQLLALLQDHPGALGKLMVEVTETARIDDLQRANRVIQGLRKEGIPVCLDDFGAGQSAFEYLRDLQVDYVKIDGRYVADATRSAKGEAFLKAMAWLCRELGVSTIAERIEIEQELAFIKECGIAFGQGYLFGKPSLSPTLTGLATLPRRPMLG